MLTRSFEATMSLLPVGVRTTILTLELSDGRSAAITVDERSALGPSSLRAFT